MEEYKVKFMCSYGGEVQPRAHDNHLSYIGGHTKILYVHRGINFPAMLAELSALSAAASVSFKYQLPGDDALDALISVTDDNDLHNMMLEYDHLHHDSPTRARMRLFLFPNNPPSNTFIASDPNPIHPIKVQQLQRVVDHASSSSSSSYSFGPFPEKYDVFISFRGEDTRTKFACHLLEALDQKQIKTFIDYELHKGDEISPSLFRAIENSHVSVVVFSKNYASSKWCLEELVKILECRKERGQVVVPVFYDIDPSHVRKQVGSYEEAFKKHKQNSMLDMNKVKEWKEALSEAANLVGWDSHSRSYRDDNILIQKIVEDVLQRLSCHYPPNYFKSLVGIDKSSAPLESLLEEAQSVGMWGMGGIGKTTIARDIFGKYSHLYDGSCFLENVREKSGKDDKGLNNLRNQLYSKLLKDKICQDSTEKSTLVECRLRRQRNFIVLDDVSRSKQLEFLMGELQSFGPGSRIIITTRDKSVLENSEVEKIHEVEGLDFQESLTLFSLKAFKKDCPKMGYEELSQRAIDYCKGSPLALTVLGSFLHSKTEIEWVSALKKLKKTLNKEIQSVLQLSYDELDYEEKQIFLDIACFLKGQNEGDVVNVLNSCGLHAIIGMRSLLDKALITINNSVWMHDLIQHMGWEIVHQESIENPEHRSRLWDFYDTSDVLENNKGTNAIRGLLLDTSESQQDLSLGADTFKEMSNLRYLIISSCHGRRLCNLKFPMGLESFPAKLRYLEWDAYPLRSLPSNFCPEKLVTLSMPDGRFKRLWGGVQNLVNLKKVYLRGCRELIELPDFSKAQNLIRVDLGYCRSLRHVRPSSLSLGTLEWLDLQHCEKIEALESEIHLKSLWHLDIIGCSSLRKLSLSSDIEVLNLTTGVKLLHFSIGRKLECLVLDGHRLENLRREFSCLKALVELTLYRCGRTLSKQSLRVIFDGLQSLQKLSLQDCRYLFELPSNVCRLSSLRELKLDGSSVERLPESIKRLLELEILSLRNCRRLRYLPELPSSIISLDALNCTMLQTVASSLTNSRPQEHEHRSISFQNPVKDITVQIRELAHEYELRERRRGGRTPSSWFGTFDICYPNHEVPEWFTYRTKGASITFELAQPSDQYFSFLLCIVLSQWSPPEYYPFVHIEYRCYLENGDNGHKYSTPNKLRYNIPTERDSAHVCMLLDRFNILEAIKRKRVNHQSNPKVTLEFFGYCYSSVVKQWKPDKDQLIKECGVYPLNASSCCIKEKELELGMKNKRLREIPELDHSENGVDIGSSDDQGLLPATKKLKEIC